MKHYDTIRTWTDYFLRPLLCLIVGGAVTAMLVHFILVVDETVWEVLLVPMLLLTVFLTVIGLANIWIRYRTWRDDMARAYSWRTLLWLYVRCFFVVAAGMLLATAFYLLVDLLPPHIRALFADWVYLFYAVCAALTVTALLSIIRGENLQEIRFRNAQNENLLLRSQLNPHFLYNTLNNIDALIWIDQAKASDATCRLSALMRSLTYDARRPYVTLAEEVEQLHQLADLQRLRMSTPNALVVETDVADGSRHIAPLMLMPLVENTFKHCGNLDAPRAIVIRLRADATRLVFSTDNNLPQPSPDDARQSPPARSQTARRGVGQEVLRRRLQLLYPGRFSFTAGLAPDGRYRAELVIRWAR